MKLKNIIISFITGCVLMFQITIANATTIPNGYIDQQYATDVMPKIYTQFTDSAMQKISQYKFYIVNQELYKIPALSKNNFDKNNKGFTDLKNKEVVVYADMKEFIPTKEHIYHEIGHCLDNFNGIDGLYSDTEEYKKIAAEESKNILPYSGDKYIVTDIHEEFAECIALCITRPVVLKNVAPKTYEYINKLGFIKPGSLEVPNPTKDVTGWNYFNHLWSYSENGRWANGITSYKMELWRKIQISTDTI